jgi:RNA polymerase sigma-70 factor (sigma-E family)
MMMVTMPTVMGRKEDAPAGKTLRDLYREHRRSLVVLASLLLHNEADAEEVVQDAFIKVHLAWGRLRSPDKALPYLRSAVLNGARSRLRHQRVVERMVPNRRRPSDSAASAESVAMAGADRRRVVAVLRSLPGRQRECLVLRYYLDLAEADIAATLGISAGSVKTHLHRGLLAVAARLEPRP